MFSKDRFHPSAAGYARAAAALLPSVCAALGVWGADTSDRAPEPRRGEGVGPVAVAAGQAVKEPGTEVAPTEIAGQSRGPRGRWAVVLRRRHDDVPPAEDPVAPSASSASGRLGRPGRSDRAAGLRRPDRAGAGSVGTMASSSTSTFQRWSTRPATTTIVLAGRISPKISPWTVETASTTSSSVMKWRVRMTSSGRPPSSASAPRAISQQRRAWDAGVDADVPVGVDRRGARRPRCSWPTRTARENPTLPSYGDPDDARLRVVSMTLIMSEPRAAAGASRRDRRHMPVRRAPGIPLDDRWASVRRMPRTASERSARPPAAPEEHP